MIPQLLDAACGVYNKATFHTRSKEDCLRVCDINRRPPHFNRDVVHESLKLSNILKLNDNELPVVANLLQIAGSELDILDTLTTRYNLRLIALTKGEHGSLLHTPDNRTSTHPGFPVRVVDDVGAGDAFTAAMIVGSLQRLDLNLINWLANAVASYVCTKEGATPDMPR